MPERANENSADAQRRSNSLQSTKEADPLVRLVDLTYRFARRIAVAVVGTTLLAVGVVLVFTPGPAIVVLSLGLAVLAVEFAWARRWLRELKATANKAVEKVRESRRDAGTKGKNGGAQIGRD